MKRLALSHIAIGAASVFMAFVLLRNPSGEACGAEAKQSKEHAFVFRDAGDQAGLLPGVAGIRGHAAGWGDVDGDGWVDLYVGTFAESGSKANQLFRNNKGKLGLASADVPAFNGRTNSALFADLDNDGDLDLYVASMPKPEKQLRGCGLFQSD